jgi:hypothetical protein
MDMSSLIQGVTEIFAQNLTEKEIQAVFSRIKIFSVCLKATGVTTGFTSAMLIGSRFSDTYVSYDWYWIAVGTSTFAFVIYFWMGWLFFKFELSISPVLKAKLQETGMPKGAKMIWFLELLVAFTPLILGFGIVARRGYLEW